MDDGGYGLGGEPRALAPAVVHVVEDMRQGEAVGVARGERAARQGVAAHNVLTRRADEAHQHGARVARPPALGKVEPSQLALAHASRNHTVGKTERIGPFMALDRELHDE